MNQTPNSLLNSLTQGYFTDQTVLDECFNASEGTKETWRQLLANIENLGPAEFKNRQQELLKINGTSNGLPTDALPANLTNVKLLPL